MKVGIVSPYLQTLGGGERYVFTVAKFFLDRGDSVDFYETEGITSQQINERFGIDLSKANFFTKPKTTFGYDLFFFLSDGSIPFSFADKNILHFQVPFKLTNQKTFANRIKLSRFNHIICNSQFTRRFVDQTYGIKSEVLYPPVDVASFQPGKKENIILSVGRFFQPLHPKKQEILVKAFQEMNLANWKLVLVGGVTLDSNEGVKKLRDAIGKAKIEIVTDSSFKDLKNYYAGAKIYWHAAGYGEDLGTHPERAEHFGITTVEAMAAGCATIVFPGGGQKEIVQDKKNGFYWETEKQLINITRKLANNSKNLAEISANAIVGASKFSCQEFNRNLEKLCAC